MNTITITSVSSGKQMLIMIQDILCVEETEDGKARIHYGRGPNIYFVEAKESFNLVATSIRGF